jgi:hypothetical protein
MLLIVTRSAEARRQLLLDRLEIVRQVLQADLAVVTVFLYLMEDGPPDRHLARAVRGHSFISSDDLLDARSRESTSIPLCDRREVGQPGVERRRNRTVTPAVRAVASSAVGAIYINALEGSSEPDRLLGFALCFVVRLSAGHSKKPGKQNRALQTQLENTGSYQFHIQTSSRIFCSPVWSCSPLALT